MLKNLHAKYFERGSEFRLLAVLCSLWWALVPLVLPLKGGGDAICDVFSIIHSFPEWRCDSRNSHCGCAHDSIYTLSWKISSVLSCLITPCSRFIFSVYRRHFPALDYGYFGRMNDIFSLPTLQWVSFDLFLCSSSSPPFMIFMFYFVVGCSVDCRHNIKVGPWQNCFLLRIQECPQSLLFLSVD